MLFYLLIGLVAIGLLVNLLCRLNDRHNSWLVEMNTRHDKEWAELRWQKECWKLYQRLQAEGLISNGRRHRVSLRVIARHLEMNRTRSPKTHAQVRRFVKQLGLRVLPTTNRQLVVLVSNA